MDTSAAFFLSIEFQNTGYFVYRMYGAAFGDAAGTSTFPSTHTLPVPAVRYEDFMPDTQRIGEGVVVGQGNWQQRIEDNKNAFALSFVQRQQFTAAYPSSLTADQFVTQLNQNAGQVLTDADRSALVSALGSTPSDPAKRAQVLRAVAEGAAFSAREKNRAFVLMQYFGYLRRNPNSGPDSDYTGYDFWLGKLNQFGGDFRSAEMVRAFIESAEYRARFGRR